MVRTLFLCQSCDFLSSHIATIGQTFLPLWNAPCYLRGLLNWECFPLVVSLGFFLNIIFLVIQIRNLKYFSVVLIYLQAKWDCSWNLFSFLVVLAPALPIVIKYPLWNFLFCIYMFSEKEHGASICDMVSFISCFIFLETS